MKRLQLASLCLILVAGCHLSPVSAPVVTETPPAIGPVQIPHATVVYYDISGSTASELRVQLDAWGAGRNDGYKGDARTTWYIRWTWPGYGSASCNLNETTVSYDIQVLMPRWNPPANASSDLVVQWAHYTQALAEHEKGHVDWVVDHCPSVEAAIKKATCETAEAAAQAALVPIRQHDVDYDTATDHGAAQGARFP